ncbi:MAG: hypothetical protein WBG46_04185 [Nonlabens sp.]
MYTLNITNNFPDTITMSGNGSINSGDSGSVEKLGNLTITIPGVGQARLFDLGEKKLPGYDFPKETWGVLLRYQTIETYYRYEGGGELKLVIDEYGSITVSTTNGNMINVSLPELTIATSDD